MIAATRGHAHRKRRRNEKRASVRRLLYASLEQLESRRVLVPVLLDHVYDEAISQAGEADFFTLDVSDNRRASISIDSAPSGTADLGGAHLVLRAPDDTVVATSDVASGNPKIRDVQLATSGIYTIEVSALNHRSKSAGRLSVALSRSGSRSTRHSLWTIHRGCYRPLG